MPVSPALQLSAWPTSWRSSATTCAQLTTTSRVGVRACPQTFTSWGSFWSLRSSSAATLPAPLPRNWNPSRPPCAVSRRTAKSPLPLPLTCPQFGAAGRSVVQSVPPPRLTSRTPLAHLSRDFGPFGSPLSHSNKTALVFLPPPSPCFDTLILRPALTLAVCSRWHYSVPVVWLQTMLLSPATTDKSLKASDCYLPAFSCFLCACCNVCAFSVHSLLSNNNYYK